MKTPQPKKPFQIQRMFGLARKPADNAGIDVKEYIATVAAGVVRREISGLSQLTFDEANDVIVALGGTAFQYRGLSKRAENYRKQQAGIKTVETAPHVQFLHKLAERRGMSEEGLTNLASRMNLPYPPHTTEQGNKLIEAIKAMNARDERKAGKGQQSPGSKKSAQPGFRRVA